MSAFAYPFTVCKNKVDSLGVKSLDFSPEPPRAGRELEVIASGTPLIDLDSGFKVTVDVKVWGVSVLSETHELCDLVQCPIPAGKEFTIKIAQPISPLAPANVKATVHITLKNAEGEEKSCLESTVAVAKSEKHNLLGGVRPVEFLFQQWKRMYPRATHNFAIFAENWERIMKHNLDPTQTYVMEMNEFGSMTADEFARERMGVRMDLATKEHTGSMLPQVFLRNEPSLADPPTEIDWTTKGVVTKVKNQGRCGSCWAFSAIGALESAYAIKTGKLVDLAEQELVSCDTVDSACQGGLMDNAFRFLIKRNKGMCTTESYPYTSGTTGSRGACTATCEPVEGTVPKEYKDISRNEKSLLAAVALNGPVSVAIQADQAAFQFYKSGVMTGICGAHLDHGVLLVGYGVDPKNGHKFWKLKNSWGASWGEEGYIRIVRGKFWPLTGQCGIAAAASYPIL